VVTNILLHHFMAHTAAIAAA